MSETEVPLTPNVATAPGAPTDASHRVHFAPTSQGEDDTALWLPWASLVALASTIVIVLGVALQVTFGWGWGPGWVVEWALRVAIVLALAFALWRAWRNHRWQTQHTGLPARAPRGWRLRCVGSPDELEQVGELRDVPFEPRQFWIPFGLPEAARVKRWRWAVTLVAAAGALYLGCRVSGAPKGLAIYVLAAGAAGYLLAGVVAPAYIRVTPGRLEVIQHLLPGSPLVRPFDLHTARVLVDLRREYIVLTRPGKTLLKFSLVFIPRRKELAYYMFLGALSSYAPPEAEPDN